MSAVVHELFPSKVGMVDCSPQNTIKAESEGAQLANHPHKWKGTWSSKGRITQQSQLKEPQQQSSG